MAFMLVGTAGTADATVGPTVATAGTADGGGDATVGLTLAASAPTPDGGGTAGLTLVVATVGIAEGDPTVGLILVFPAPGTSIRVVTLGRAGFVATVETDAGVEAPGSAAAVELALDVAMLEAGLLSVVVGLVHVSGGLSVATFEAPLLAAAVELAQTRAGRRTRKIPLIEFI